MVSAKDLYKKLCIQILNEHFVSKGWKRSGYSWKKVDEKSNNFMDINVYKAYSYTDEVVSFMVEINVANNDFVEWHSQLVTANKTGQMEFPDYDGEVVKNRNGVPIVYTGSITYGEITPGINIVALGKKVISSIEQYIGIYVNQHEPVNNVIRQLIATQAQNNTNTMSELMKTHVPSGTSYIKLSLPMRQYNQVVHNHIVL